MRWLYPLILLLLLPVVLTALAIRARRQTGRWDATRERLGYVTPAPPGAVIWVHASSVGEMQAAIPLVKALAVEYPAAHLVVTSFTASGMQRARAAFGETVQVCALPYDLPGFNHRFLNRIRPLACIVMETEIWPNLFRQAAERRLPLLIASGRLTERSLLRYRRFGGLVRAALANVKYLGAQSEADAGRFKALGVPANAVKLVGNLKFDIPESAEATEQGKAMRQILFGESPVLIAASTRVGEDDIVLRAFAQVRERFQDARLVIVPRHPERGNSVAALARDAGFETALRSADSMPEALDVYVVDTIGELNAFYAAADAAFVGGSLVPVGGHNLLEPASLGIPVLTGPHHFNTPDIYQAMFDAGGLVVVSDADSLARAWLNLLSDPVRRDELGQTAHRIVEQNRGTLNKVLEDLAPFLNGAR